MSVVLLVDQLALELVDQLELEFVDQMASELVILLDLLSLELVRLLDLDAFMSGVAIDFYKKMCESGTKCKCHGHRHNRDNTFPFAVVGTGAIVGDFVVTF